MKNGSGAGIRFRACSRQVIYWGYIGGNWLVLLRHFIPFNVSDELG